MLLKNNPLLAVKIGVAFIVVGFLLPNGVKIFSYAELIGIYNLMVTLCQGLGIGLVIGGGALFLKAKKQE